MLCAVGLLQRPGLFASARPVDAADFRPFVARLAATLHLAVVAHSASPKVALLYGESSQLHKICVAVRQRDASKVCNVDIKATNKTLADNLCNEADQLSDVSAKRGVIIAARARLNKHAAGEVGSGTGQGRKTNGKGAKRRADARTRTTGVGATRAGAIRAGATGC